MHTPKYIYERIEDKQSDYEQYNFTQKEHIALATFFDLSQEFDNIKDMYSLFVAILKAFFNVNARLYLIEQRHNAIMLVSKTEDPESNLYIPPLIM